MADIDHKPPGTPRTNPSPVTRFLEATREYVDERFKHLYREFGNAGVQAAISAMPDFLQMAEDSFDTLYAARMPLPGGYTVSRIAHGEVTVTRKDPDGAGWTDTIVAVNDLSGSLVISEQPYSPAATPPKSANHLDPYRDENITLVSRLIGTIRAATVELAGRDQQPPDVPAE